MVFTVVGVSSFGIISAAIVSFVLGFLWYGPLFGKIWMKYMGYKNKDINKEKQKGMMKSYLTMFLLNLLMIWIFSLFMLNLNMVDMTGALSLAFWLWLGFTIPKEIGIVLWEGKPFGLYVLNVLYGLANFLVIGLVLSYFI